MVRTLSNICNGLWFLKVSTDPHRTSLQSINETVFSFSEETFQP